MSHFKKRTWNIFCGRIVTNRPHGGECRETKTRKNRLRLQRNKVVTRPCHSERLKIKQIKINPPPRSLRPWVPRYTCLRENRRPLPLRARLHHASAISASHTEVTKESAKLSTHSADCERGSTRVCWSPLGTRFCMGDDGAGSRLRQTPRDLEDAPFVRGGERVRVHSSPQTLVGGFSTSCRVWKAVGKSFFPNRQPGRHDWRSETLPRFRMETEGRYHRLRSLRSEQRVAYHLRWGACSRANNRSSQAVLRYCHLKRGLVLRRSFPRKFSKWSCLVPCSPLSTLRPL